MEDFSHSFSWDEEANVSFHVTWKDIDYLKWLNGRFWCISPWHEEANAFSHVIWRGIDWLRWLNGRMANRMVNGKLLVHSSMTWRQMHFLVSHEDALIGWDGQWETPHAFPHDMKRQMHFIMWYQEPNVNSSDNIVKKYWLVEK